MPHGGGLDDCLSDVFMLGLSNPGRRRELSLIGLGDHGACKVLRKGSVLGGRWVRVVTPSGPSVRDFMLLASDMHRSELEGH